MGVMCWICLASPGSFGASVSQSPTALAQKPVSGVPSSWSFGKCKSGFLLLRENQILLSPWNLDESPPLFFQMMFNWT